MSLQKRVLLLCLLSGLISEAFAQLRTIPEESGFSGFVNLGVGSVRGKSNLIAGTDVGDIGRETIDSIFDKPESKSSGVPLINFEVAYTWGRKRTQVFAGNLLEDFLRFDFATQLGVRKQFRDKSILAIGYLFTSIPTQEWADPYVANQPREETDRTASGGRITFDRIGGSGLQLQYTQREIELDDELSGRTQLGLPDAQAALLNREGDLKRLQVMYAFKISEKHRLAPALWFTDFDLDGDAMANDLVEFQITHLYLGKRFNFVTNATVGEADYDSVNPIYNTEQEDDRYGFSFTVFDKKILGAKKWWGVLTIAAFKIDSNIDFYDTDIALIGVSAFRPF